MKVILKQPQGANKDLDVESSLKVADFRARVAEELSLDKNSIRLVCSGHVLKDDKTLEEHNVKDNSVVHVVVVSRNREREQTPAQADGASQSLFTPSAGGSGGGNGASARGGAGGESRRIPPQMAGLMRQLSSNPQALAMFQQMVRNPQLMQQVVASNPGLANDPEAMAMLMNPDFIQQLSDPSTIRSLLRPREPGEAYVSREVFSVAIRCMNGEAVPQDYPQVQLRGQLDSFSEGLPGHPARSGAAGRSADSSAASGPVRMRRQFVSRDIIRQALAQFSSANGGNEEADEAESMDTGAEEEAAGPSGQSGAASGEASTADRFGPQLQLLREMGFVDEVACLQALEAAGGDVNTALQFLM